MGTTEFADALAQVNAGLNCTATVLLLSGYIAIKNKRPTIHKNCMIGAFVASTVFLIGYLTRFYLSGAHRFPDVGFVRTVYLTILITHLIGAFAIVPLVIMTVSRAIRQKFELHKKIARWTWPIWMYVSVTGVVIYLLLYQIFPQAR